MTPRVNGAHTSVAAGVAAGTRAMQYLHRGKATVNAHRLLKQSAGRIADRAKRKGTKHGNGRSI